MCKRGQKETEICQKGQKLLKKAVKMERMDQKESKKFNQWFGITA